MLLTNIYELDELPFIKQVTYKLTEKQFYPCEQNLQIDIATKFMLLPNIRSLSYQYQQIMPKIFLFQTKIRKDTSKQCQNGSNTNNFVELIVTTQKQILSLESFFYLLGKIVKDKSQFNKIVSKINKFTDKTKMFIIQKLRQNQVNYKHQNCLTFNVYLKKKSPNSLDMNKKQRLDQFIQQFRFKKNKFLIKCTINNFNYQSWRQKTNKNQQLCQPAAFQIVDQVLQKELIKQYIKLVSMPLPINEKQLNRYIKPFELLYHQIDEQYLKLQVYKNYPLIRSKFYLPIRFNDALTQQRLEGPIFSNSDHQCMFAHYRGYNADTIRQLQGTNCQECRIFIQELQQNQILMHLRDNLFNPYKADVFYCSQYNRFKLIMKVKSQNQSHILFQSFQKQQQFDKRQQQSFQKQWQQFQKQQQQFYKQESYFRTQIKYLNYLHLRANIKKLYTKRRSKFNDMMKQEKFSLSFQFWGHTLLIMDPARGRYCSHYQFTDLRLFYLNKITQNSFKCPICNNIVSDNDLMYLREVQIIVKYIKFVYKKQPKLMIKSQCYIDHQKQKVFISYKKLQKGSLILEVKELQKFYQTLMDPYISFNQYSLGIPDKYQQKMKRKYLNGFNQQASSGSQQDQQTQNLYQYNQKDEKYPYKGSMTMDDEQQNQDRSQNDIIS